jgi:hypothetical protein
MTEKQVQALIVRAIKTFLQAALAFVVAGLASVSTLPAGKALLIAAIAAGVSAVTNVFIKPEEAK